MISSSQVLFISPIKAATIYQAMHNGECGEIVSVLITRQFESMSPGPIHITAMFPLSLTLCLSLLNFIIGSGVKCSEATVAFTLQPTFQRYKFPFFARSLLFPFLLMESKWKAVKTQNRAFGHALLMVLSFQRTEFSL